MLTHVAHAHSVVHDTRRNVSSFFFPMPLMLLFFRFDLCRLRSPSERLHEGETLPRRALHGKLRVTASAYWASPRTR